MHKLSSVDSLKFIMLTNKANQQVQFLAKGKTVNKSATLLMIDDNQEYLNVLADALEDSVLNVLSTTDPHEGLRMMMVSDIDLVLLDIDMPGLNGIEILQQIRGLKRIEMIPVVIMSAREDHDTILKLKSLGVRDYLLKPFALNDFITRIRRNLGRDIFERNVFNP